MRIEVQSEGSGRGCRINSVEHAIGDYAIKNKLKFDPAPGSTGKKAAVIGGGPGGLSCAYQLRRRGHEVTIYEASPKLGGMVRYGIMGYRVDRTSLTPRFSESWTWAFRSRRVWWSAETSHSMSQQKSDDAVFIGIGAQKGRNLPVPGSEGTDYSSNAIKFLADFEHDGMGMKRGENVIIIGDGDVAMDVARLALRLGSKATILSAVPREEMNCKGYEFDEAQHEGTTFNYGVSVVEMLRDGDKVRGVRCVRMEKKAKGEDGWNSPIPFLRYKPVAGSDFEIACDMVVASIGQGTNTAGIEKATENTPFLKWTRTIVCTGSRMSSVVETSSRST